MKNRFWKHLTAVTLAAMMLLAMLAVPAMAAPEEDIFADWNKDAPALKALIEFVEAVTDESSPDYIPPADRIATFDMDGTLCGELYPTYLEYYLLERRIFCDPSYTPDEEMLEFGCMLRDHALDKSFPDGMDVLHATHAAKAYAGLTLTQFADFVTNQLVREVAAAAATVSSAGPSSKAIWTFPLSRSSAWTWISKQPMRAARTD